MEFSIEELAMIKKLGLTIPKAKPTTEPPQYKTIEGQCICTLCKTIHVQYFKMIKQPDERAWVKVEEIKFTEKPKGIEVSKSYMSVCDACFKVLMKKDKKELINMLLNLRSFHGLTATRDEIQRRDIKIRMEVKI